MAFVDVDKFAEVICNFPAIDENSANAVVCLLRRQPTVNIDRTVNREDLIDTILEAMSSYKDSEAEYLSDHIADAVIEAGYKKCLNE